MRRFLALLMVFLNLSLIGCAPLPETAISITQSGQSAALQSPAPERPLPAKTAAPSTSIPGTGTPIPSFTPAPIDKDGVYDSKEDVSLYLYTYGYLPGNYITKDEARALG